MKTSPTKPDTAVPDATLVARCLGGDERAWAALVERYQRLVYAIVMRMGMDAHGAADVFQTVFERLYKQLPRISDPTRLQAWIVTTAKREGLLICKRGRRMVSMTRADDTEAQDEGAEWDQADPSPIAEDALEQLQELHLLRQAMELLDERSRQLLTLLFGGNEDPIGYDELARRMGIPVGSIGPTRARALEKLRRAVAQLKSGDGRCISARATRSVAHAVH